MNFNQVKVEGGIAVFYTDLLQSSEDKITINGGSALITGRADGGTIQIERGMLDLGEVANFRSGKPEGPTPEFSNEFHSDIAFTGTDGSIAFGSADIKMAFDAAKNEIGISTMWKGSQVAVATVNLADNRHYAASDFTVSGDTLMYHQPGGTV